MTTDIRNAYRNDFAQSLLDDIQQQRAQYHSFMGKVNEWVVNQDGSTDFTRGAETEEYNNGVRENALLIKKILASDVSLATVRYDWQSGQVFTEYDNTKPMEGMQFYVLSSAHNVYKCLSNNGGVPSTQEPYGKPYDVLRTTDGYLWKYMYSIPSYKYTKFVDTGYMPVQNSNSNRFYNNGSVDYVNVIDGGSGYSSALATQLVVSGTTTGSGASAKVVVGGYGQITGFTDIVGGSGYTKGATVTFAPTSGVGAVLTPVFSAGVFTGFTITDGGAGYSVGEVVSLTVGGAVLIPSISQSGSITDVTIVNAGVGYTAAPTIAVTSTGLGNGVYGNATAVVECAESNGSIVYVYVKDPGTAYPKNTDTSITVSGDGTGASFSPVVIGGKVVSVIIDSPGVGYTSMRLTVVGAGIGAKVAPALKTVDYISDQSIVEQTAVKGAVYNVKVTVGGTNYTNTTQLSFSGDGTGFSAVPVIVNGAIYRVDIISYGSGYSYLDITFNDPNRGVVGTVTDAKTYAIIAPIGGHGSDAISELMATQLVINTEFRQGIGNEDLVQDYRQYGIFKNLTTPISDKIFTENSSIIAYKVQLTGTTTPVLDEVLIQDSTKVKYRVASVTDGYIYLQILSKRALSPSGTLVAATDGSRLYTVAEVISKPTVNKYSGKLLYVSNTQKLFYTDTQGIVIKTVLKF